MSSTESKEATVNSKLSVRRTFPSIKFKKRPNEDLGGELHGDQRHRHESRENLNKSDVKPRVVTVLGGDRKWK